jgi:hypothetical protein
MKLRLALFTLALFTLVACGSDGPGSGPVSQADFNEGCRVDCEHRVECGTATGTLEECITNCTDDYADVSGWLRGDAYVAITECFGGLACSADTSTCLTECQPTDAHERYEAQCREVFAPCVEVPSDLDGFCETTPMPSEQGDDTGIFCLMTPAIMDQMTACIPDGTTCQAGLTCLQGVLEQVGFD